MKNRSIWRVMASHVVCHPHELHVSRLSELRSRVQRIADAKKVRSDRPPIGKLSFRYELDADDHPCVVYAYFIGRGGTKRRFMKLERTEPCPASAQ